MQLLFSSVVNDSTYALKDGCVHFPLSQCTVDNVNLALLT